mmetsp:Transcript_32682/g.97485  ORF Transcript_32682/g.97485 Transcript_32682/m.97485 type:complete len:327 (-) Transcript_32682:274-1254(-)
MCVASNSTSAASSTVAAEALRSMLCASNPSGGLLLHARTVAAGVTPNIAGDACNAAGVAPGATGVAPCTASAAPCAAGASMSSSAFSRQPTCSHTRAATGSASSAAALAARPRRYCRMRGLQSLTVAATWHAAICATVRLTALRTRALMPALSTRSRYLFRSSSLTRKKVWRAGCRSAGMSERPSMPLRLTPDVALLFVVLEALEVEAAPLPSLWLAAARAGSPSASACKDSSASDSSTEAAAMAGSGAANPATSEPPPLSRETHASAGSAAHVRMPSHRRRSPVAATPLPEAKPGGRPARIHARPWQSADSDEAATATRFSQRPQ